MTTATTSPTLQAALTYAARGWHVIPIRPGNKTPATTNGLSDGSIDPDRIRSWWTRHPDNNIGIVTGAISGIWVLDVDIDELDDKHGDLTLQALETEFSPLPDTLTQLTPRGGHHLIWAWDPDHPARNNQSGKVGRDLDVRGDGGYIVVEPSTRYWPEGNPRHGQPDGTYTFDAGQPDTPAPAPQWLLELATRQPPAHQPSTPTGRRTDRPGDRWAADTDWAQILGPDGWTFAHMGRAGERRWVRPGKDVHHGISATTGYTDNDNLKVFTSSVPRLDADGIYTKLGYLAAIHHGGDHAAAASWCAANGYGNDAEGIDLGGLERPATVDDDSQVVELAPEQQLWEIATANTVQAIVDGTHEPLRPDLMARTDGHCLLYSGKVHSIASEPGAGKSLIALHAVAEQLHAGHRCVWVDWEDNVDTAVRRLMAMSVPPRAIVDLFTHVKPVIAIRGGGVPTDVVAATTGATLVVIDSTGEALAHANLNQNNDDEVGAWMNNTARVLTAGGATVLMIDHMVKNKDDQGRFAIGSQRKLAAIDGIAYTVTVLASPALDKVGRMLLKVSKDRHGNLAHGSTAAEITVAPGADNAIVVTVAAPDGTAAHQPEKLLTHLMEKVSRLIEDQPEGMSGKAIEGSISSRAAHVRTAIRQLVDTGAAAKIGDGRNTVYVTVEAYREPAEEAIEHLINNPETGGEMSRNEQPRPPRPTSSQPRPGRGAEPTSSTSSPSSPPYGGEGRGNDGQRPVETAPTTPISSRMATVPEIEIDEDLF